MAAIVIESERHEPLTLTEVLPLIPNLVFLFAFKIVSLLILDIVILLMIVAFIKRSKLVILFEILSLFVLFCLILSVLGKYVAKHKIENRNTFIWFTLENRLPLWCECKSPLCTRWRRRYNNGSDEYFRCSYPRRENLSHLFFCQ